MSLIMTGFVLTAAVPSAYAQSNKPDNPPGQEECKPGWGHGDKNHEHCGPPGLSIHPDPSKDILLLQSPRQFLLVVTDSLVELFQVSGFVNWLRSVT